MEKNLTKTKSLLAIVIAFIMLISFAFFLTACGGEPTPSNIVEVSSYNELVEAINGDKETIKLKNDIDIENQLNINRKLTLDLNGNKIYNSEAIWTWSSTNSSGATSMISVFENGDLTIEGNGKMVALKDDVYCVSVWDNGKLNIKDGEFVGNMHTVYVNKGVADIYGGKFSLDQKSQYDDSRYLLNLLDANGKNGTAVINVYGGTFVDFNPSDNLAENPKVDFVADGYVSVLVEGSTTNYKVIQNNQE